MCDASGALQTPEELRFYLAIFWGDLYLIIMFSQFGKNYQLSIIKY